MNQATFTQKLRGTLRDNGGRRLLRGKVSGLLDSGRVSQLFTSGGSRPAVFAEVEKRRHTSYHIGILVDASGSMQCRDDGERGRGQVDNPARYEAAFAAAHGLARSLVSSGCTVSAAAFNQFVRFWKTDELLKASPRLFAEYSKMVWDIGSHQNYDATALELMRRHVQRQPESVRLIVVLSDGHPSNAIEQSLKASYERAAAWFYPQADGVRQVIRRCESSGLAVVGVGIQSDAVTSLYKRHAVVNNLDELYPALLGEVGRVIKRGR
jgi:cobalamin biosynthesis protein CobT